MPETPGYRLFKFAKERDGEGGPNLDELWGIMSESSRNTWEKEAQAIGVGVRRLYDVRVLVHHNESFIVDGVSEKDAIENAEMDASEKYADAVMIEAFDVEEKE